jgi:hypothetical protein
MSADISRQRFDPRKHFSGVLMQQGRVQLDADWNEWAEILDRRWRAETTDLFWTPDLLGRAVVPRETPDGFKITLPGGVLTIGRGRAYVHGLLAENHGKDPQTFDAVLSELRGTAAVPYAEQPYLRHSTDLVPSPTSGGPHLVYLDVWQREVTFVEDPALIEKAVGVDTTTRTQTVWQVKVLADVGADVTCATPDAEIPGWLNVIRPSAGRVTTDTVPVAPEEDPCQIPPGGGYRGLENRLYRVEIHSVDPVTGAATFKWSRDNASVVAAVTAINSTRTELTLSRTGRDEELRFHFGDWVEVTDDRREFAGLPGFLFKAANVLGTTRTLVLDGALPAGQFPTGAEDIAARHVRVRRWDQKGKVFNGSGAEVFDLDTAASPRAIPVTVGGTGFRLEHGVRITFSTVPAGGRFRVGDYWVFAARTADATVEELVAAPPRGTHHHYARLALVTFPATATDCRVLWPPEVAAGTGCDCTVCVTPESHNGGTLTIQQALDQVREAGGGKVCLEAGTYNLGESPVVLTGLRSVRLQGHGWQTRLVYLGDGPALVVEDSFDVVIDDLTVLASPRGDPADLGRNGVCVALRNSAGVTLRRCVLVQLAAPELRLHAGPAVGLEGVLLLTVLKDNLVWAGTGIGNLPPAEEEATPSLLTAGLLIDDNVFACDRRAVSLEGFSVHAAATRLAGNQVFGCAEAGILLTGTAIPNVPPPLTSPTTASPNISLASSVEVRGNTLRVRGHGIVLGTSETRICENDISAAADGPGGHGIELRGGLDQQEIDHCQVLGNRVLHVAGHGIAITGRVRSAMIKQNMIEGAGLGGVVITDTGSADVLTVENNQLLNIGPRRTQDVVSVAGIRILAAERADVIGNVVRGVGLEAVTSRSRVGILVIGSRHVRVAGNEVTDVGPAEAVGESLGIEATVLFGRLDVVENTVRRSRAQPVQGGTDWLALRVRGRVLFRALDSLLLVTAGDSVVGFHGNRPRASRPAEDSVAVRGNGLEGWGGNDPVVDVQVSGSCTFNDNDCSLEPDSNAPVVVVLAAKDAIVSMNNVRRPGDREAVRLVVDPKRFTALGNITNVPIKLFVGGVIQPLPPPWKDFNIPS